jgi:malate dehydrogenase (oxaloacetate-decarboxylating)(NADP+)
MANPDPEITPEDAKKARDDVIIATGRSDYPNQVNNVLGFPYIFRGALDVRAKTINMEMKIAAAQDLANLAREDVPDEVAAAYGGAGLRFGRGTSFGSLIPRLIHVVPIAVAKAAMASRGGASPVVDLDAWRNCPRVGPDRRRNATHRSASAVPQTRGVCRRRRRAGDPRRLFIRQSGSWRGHSGWPGRPRAQRRQGGGSRSSDKALRFTTLAFPSAFDYAHLYERLQRKGYLFAMPAHINQDRNYFAAAMVARGTPTRS